MNIKEKNIVVVGIGLIGGSLLKAIRSFEVKTLKGIEMFPNIIDKCKEKNLIDNKVETDEEILRQADLVFICLYPKMAIEFLISNMKYFKTNAIITDVIGLKSSFMNQVRNIKRDDITFIGGHPMAGREGRGFDMSCESIFVDANYLLVTENNVNSEHVDLLKDIVYKLGCKHVETLSSDEHDKIIAYTSHMPHILSATFMSCNDFEKTKHCIAGSFKDFTRVADINPELWTELIMENREFVLDEITKFKNRLTELENGILDFDNELVHNFLDKSRLKKKELSL